MGSVALLSIFTFSYRAVPSTWEVLHGRLLNKWMNDLPPSPHAIGICPTTAVHATSSLYKCSPHAKHDGESNTCTQSPSPPYASNAGNSPPLWTSDHHPSPAGTTPTLKKKKKIKKHSTRLCGHSTAAPCGHLRSELTVWPVWLPLWVGKGKLVRWARFTEARQLGRSLGPRQSRDLGWVMEEQVEEGHYQEQPDTEQGEWQPQCPADLILPQLSPWDRGGRRCELECANFLNHASLECVSNTRRGAL